MNLKKLFCRHTHVRVIRYHRDVVPKGWMGKELYVDRHRVVNFAQCTLCKEILKGVQNEPLFDSVGLT